LYQYILEHPNGLTKDAVSSARTSLSESFERLSHADEAPSKSEVHDVIDAWNYSNDLRITVGKINANFRKVEHLPGMKNWMITRVGDSFRIQAKS
jgi:DNA/RNA-binding domain of Phe-tRNA-synthetase-like protein